MKLKKYHVEVECDDDALCECELEERNLEEPNSEEEDQRLHLIVAAAARLSFEYWWKKMAQRMWKVPLDHEVLLAESTFIKN